MPAGEDFEITGNAAAVPHVRQARCVLCGSNQEFLLLTKLLGSAVRNQGIGNLPERTLDRLFIAEHELLLLGFSQADVGSQPPCRKDRLSERSAKVPQSRRPGE